MAPYSVRKKDAWYTPASPKPYKLSRTRIDNFFKCPFCFWIEERRGVKRPDGYPFTLNIAVDALLKKEFDIHRAAGSAHPLMEAYGLKAVPFQHEQMDAWRHNFTGVQHLHTPTNLLIFGAVDDVWRSQDNQLMVVDYKATSKVDTPTLEGSLGAQYKRQMEVYQWLLRQNGFAVSDMGYFVYVNGKKDAKAFDGKLDFDVILLPCKGDAMWIEPTLLAIKKCLEQKEPPAPDPLCEYCAYRRAVLDVGSDVPEVAVVEKKEKKTRAVKKDLPPATGKLF